MRKRETVVVPAWPGNRDAGKTFVITEMPAAQAEKWALRAFLALKGSEERIPDGIQGLGMVGVAIIGLNVFLQADIDFSKIEPLLDEMMTCVQIVRDPGAADHASGLPVATSLVSPDDIEEVATRAWLRSEVLRVHTGFSPADALSALVSAISSKAPETSSNMPTSPRTSDGPSPDAQNS